MINIQFLYGALNLYVRQNIGDLFKNTLLSNIYFFIQMLKE
jgi:hypothetical protein